MELSEKKLAGKAWTGNKGTARNLREDNMANLIKVKHVTTGEDYGKKNRPTETMQNILSQVFPDQFGKSEIQGVHFQASYDSYFRTGELNGIQLYTGSYGNTVRRRVMIKNGFIDGDAIKSKHAELAIKAVEIAKIKEEKSNLYKSSLQTYESICKEVGYDRYDPDHDRNIAMWEESPQSIRIDFKVNGTQLKAIEELIGEHKVELLVSVPADKAIAVYNIMKGTK